MLMRPGKSEAEARRLFSVELYATCEIFSQPTCRAPDAYETTRVG